MTLVEIKTKVPELQARITDLVKLNEDSNKRLAEIETEIQQIQDLKKIQDDAIQSYDTFISQYESSTDPKMKTAAGEYKKQKAKADRIRKTHQDAIEKLKDEIKEITKPDSEYSKRATNIEQAKAELDQICDILVQDPTINYYMKIAVTAKFNEKIEEENAKKESYQTASKDIGKALQDDSKDGLKTLMDELKSAKEELDESLDDPKKDSNAAKLKYIDAKKKLTDQIKAKYSIDIKPMDIDYMISAVSSNQLDDLSLPSVDLAIKNIGSVVSKLEESKQKILAEIEKRVGRDTTLTPEMEQNKMDIERLTGEVDGLEIEIATMDTELADLDEKIKDKEDELGDPSEDYIKLKEAEENLKENHIITTDALPDLLDEKSDLSKKYKEFEDADLAVRKAFQLCKAPVDNDFLETMSVDDRRKEAIDILKQAISNYQKIAKELGSLSGYDAEAWQNYLAENINTRVMDDENVDVAYYHTDDRNFKEMIHDKDVMNGEKALDKYRDVEGSLTKINSAQNKILKGEFDLPVEELFMDSREGYYKLMDDLQNAGRLDKETHGYVSVYDLMGDSGYIEPTPLNRIKGFFKRIVSKFRGPRLPFDIPEDRQKAIDAYQEAKTEDVEKEIESRRGLEKLIQRRKTLGDIREAKASERMDKKDELIQAEEKRVQLEKAAPARESQIATKEEIDTAIYVDHRFVDEAVDKVERDLGEDR